MKGSKSTSRVCEVVQSRLVNLTGLYHVSQVFHVTSHQLTYSYMLDEIQFRVKEFSNIGNQYIGNFKKGYKQCKSCGKNYRIKSENDFSSKYCQKCAKEKHKQVNRISLSLNVLSIELLNRPLHVLTILL